MKELEKEFTGRGQVKGFKFTQMDQTNKGFMYEVLADGQIHYEVFKRVLNTRYECISYPTDKAFGLWAWTTRDKNKALNRFNNL
jgi:hypothetical protein